MQNWVKLYTTTNYTEADIIKGMLEENSIRVTIMNKFDSNLKIGEIELYVPKEFAGIALDLLSKSLMN